MDISLPLFGGFDGTNQGGSFNESTMGTRGIRHLDCTFCVSISTPVCGDITISAMTSGCAVTAWDYTLASAVVQTVLHEVRLFESFHVKVSLQGNIAFGKSPRQALPQDLQHLRPSPTPAKNSQRAYNKVIVTSSSGAVNLDTCRTFTVEYFLASPRRPLHHLHRFLTAMSLSCA